ncbi:ROK family protein [Alkalicoccus luteus]|uniref:ROK family protein n=1 Tax=Alkalicoccus luteus TaxID=1237094 RepID=UPI0040336422
MYAVLDIGGTTIKYGLAAADGSLHHIRRVPTLGKDRQTPVMETVLGLCKALLNEHPVQGIAISSAGQIDSRNGRVVFATESLPDYTGTPVKSELEDQFKVPVSLENDVNCTLLGEKWKGVAQAHANVLCLSFGTGIGGAVMIDHALYHGNSYSAGEFGHMHFAAGGIACPCGDSGCFEMYASSRALEQQLQKKTSSSKTLPVYFQNAQSGSQEELAAIEEWASYVSLGIKSLAHAFNPSMIVIGGGIAEQGTFISDKIQYYVDSRIMASYKPLHVRTATHQNDANLLGALYHHLKQHHSY